MSDKNSSSEPDVPTGYRLEPDGVLEIGTIDRPVEIPDWYRQRCERSFDKLVVRSNGETIARRPDGLILTDDERAQPLAAHHYLDEDDILCFSGLPEDRKLLNRIWAFFRKLFGSRISEQIDERRGFQMPKWYEIACYRQGNLLTCKIKGKYRYRIVDYEWRRSQ